MASRLVQIKSVEELSVLRIAGLVHYADRHGLIVPCSEDLFDDNWEVFMHLCRGGFVYLVEEDESDG